MLMYKEHVNWFYMWINYFIKNVPVAIKTLAVRDFLFRLGFPGLDMTIVETCSGSIFWQRGLSRCCGSVVQAGCIGISSSPFSQSAHVKNQNWFWFIIWCNFITSDSEKFLLACGRRTFVSLIPYHKSILKLEAGELWYMRVGKKGFSLKIVVFFCNSNVMTI